MSLLRGGCGTPSLIALLDWLTLSYLRVESATMFASLGRARVEGISGNDTLTLKSTLKNDSFHQKGAQQAAIPRRMEKQRTSRSSLKFFSETDTIDQEADEIKQRGSLHFAPKELRLPVFNAAACRAQCAV